MSPWWLRISQDSWWQTCQDSWWRTSQDSRWRIFQGSWWRISGGRHDYLPGCGGAVLVGVGGEVDPLSGTVQEHLDIGVTVHDTGTEAPFSLDKLALTIISLEKS